MSSRRVLPDLQTVMTHALCILVTALCLFASHAVLCSTVVPTVTIYSGPILGVSTSIAGERVTVNKYLGIPLAASPTRWAPPTSPTPWSEPYNATRFGPACLQQFN